MFKHITLRDWRNFHPLFIDLDKNINIITGNVGCGKTNVLRGVAEISRVLTNNNIIKTKYDDFGHSLEYKSDITSEISYIFHPIQGYGTIGYTLGQESNNIVYESLDIWYSDMIEQYDVLVMRDHKGNKSILPRCKNLNTNLKLDKSLVRYIKHNTISSEHMFDIAFDKFYEIVDGMYYTDLSDEYLDEAVEFIGKYSLIGEFNSFLREFNIKLNIDSEYNEQWRDMTISLNSERVGFKVLASYSVRKLAILFRLLWRDLTILRYKTKEQRYTTLLIDNFDLGLNRMIVEKLIKLFTSSNTQVILSISDANLGLSYIERRPNIIYIGD